MSKLEDILNKHSNSIRKITDINDDILDILVKLIEHIESKDMKNDRLFEVASQFAAARIAHHGYLSDNYTRMSAGDAKNFITEFNRITGEK